MKKYVVICEGKFVLCRGGGIYWDSYESALRTAKTLVKIDKKEMTIAETLTEIRPSDEIIIEEIK